MKMKPMQILVVIALGSFIVWIASRVMHFYAPDAKGTGIYYAFALFMLFSMGILDLRVPSILPDP